MATRKQSTKADPIYDPETGSTIWVDTIDPVGAERLLASTPEGHNVRKLSPAHVANLAKDAIDDGFEFNGDPVRMDSAGAVVDGQHRLRAIIDSGQSLRCIMVQSRAFDLPSTVATIDSAGLSRTVGQILSHDGRSRANSFAALARWVLLFERGTDSFDWISTGPRQKRGSGKPSIRAVQAWLKDNDAEASWAINLTTPAKLDLQCSHVAIATLALQCLRKFGADVAEEFFGDMVQRPVPTTPQCALLRETILRRRMDKGMTYRAAGGAFVYGASVRALAAYIRGARLLRITPFRKGTVTTPVTFDYLIGGLAP